MAKAINDSEKTTTVIKGSNTHIQSKVDGNNTEYTVSADKTTVTVSGALKKTETSSTDATTQAVTTDYAIDLSDATKAQIAKEEGVVVGDNVTVIEDGTNDTGGKKYKVALKNNLNLGGTGSVTTGDTTINNDGLKVGDVTVTNAPVTVNGNPVNNINDAINQTAIQAFKPLTFAGDSGDNVTRKLGETVNVKGGVTDATKLSDGNIGVVANGSDTLDIKLAKNITVDSVKAGDTTINNDGVTINNGSLFTKDKVDVAGNKITNVKAGENPNDAVNVSQLQQAQKAATTKVEGDQGVTVTPTDNADGSKTYTVAAKTDNVTTEVDSNGNIAAITGDITTDGKGNANTTMPNALATAQTVTDAINNSGFTAKANSDTGEFISSGDEVNFIDGKNINITRDGANFTIATVAKPVFETVQVGGDTGPIISNDGNNIKVGDKDGNATKITNVANGEGDNDAVNVSQLKAGRTTVTSSDKSISVVDTNNGQGDNFAYDIKVNNQVIVEDAQLPVVYTNNQGDKVYKQNDGTFNTKPDGTGDTVQNGDVIASMQNADGNTTTPTTLTNVKSNLPSTYNNDVYNTGNEPVTKVQTLPANINTSNVATIGDVLNSGWNLQGNGEAKDFVKAYDTVNFVNGTGTTAKVTSNAKGTSSDVTFDINTDGTTITTKEVADPNNPGKTTTQVTANTTKLGDTNNDGKVDAPADADKGKLVNAGDVANAINNAGFTLTAQGENGSLVKPGATVDMKNTDNNIVIGKSADNNDVVYNLAKNITVDSVKAGDTTINNDGITINNGPSFTKDKVDVAGNKITNVADGDISATSKDAINGSQLHNAINNINTNVKAAKTEVTSQDKTVTIKEATNANGGAVYDLAVNTDGTTITTNKDGQITANTTNLTNTPDGKVAEPTNPNSLVNAGDITKAINNSGFNIQTNGGDKELVKTGETVNFVNGDNIQITNDGKNITVATAKDVKFDSVNVGDTVNITNKGIDAGNTAIANVKAGTADTDAVNVGQLNEAVSNINSNITNNNKSLSKLKINPYKYWG